MSTPLSPLTSSCQNSRVLSSGYDGAADKSNIGELPVANPETENSFFSPNKSIDNSLTHARPSLNFDVATYGSGNEDSASPRQFQSSPFHYDGRDDTVDMRMLRYRQTSLGIIERSATPRKRSYELVPDDKDEEPEQYNRSRRVSGRRDAPDINVYVDEDPSYNYDRSIPECAGQDIASSMVEGKHNEGMSTVLRENNDPVTQGPREDSDFDDTDDDAVIDESHDPLDDTCLSTFSAVPNVDMTQFAKLRSDSPFKGPRPLPNCPVKTDENTNHNDSEPATPVIAKRSPRKNALIDMSSPVGSPTPRKRNLRDGEEPSETPN